MEQRTQRKRSRGWLRRGLRALLVVTAVLVGLLTLAYFTRNTLVAPLALDWLAARLERERGLVLTVDDVGGDWFSDLRLSGVELQARSPGNELQRFAVQELALELDLRRLLAGDLAWIERLDARDVELALDLTRPSGSAAQPRPSAFVWPARLPPGSLTRLALAIALPDGRALRFEQVGLSVGVAAEGNSATLDIARAELDLWPGSAPLVERAHGEFGYRAGTLELRELDMSGDVALRATDSRLALADVAGGRLAWEANLATCGGELASRGFLDRRDVHLTLSAHAVELAEVWRLIAPLTADIPRARVDVEGELVVTAGRLHAAASVDALDACVLGRTADFIHADAVYADRALDVARLDLRRGPNSVSARELAVTFEPGTWIERLRASRGAFEVDLGDVSELTLIEVAHLPEHRVRASGRLDALGIELSSGRLTTPGGELDVRRGRFEWGADPTEWFAGARFDIDANADFHDLAPFTELIGRGAWSGSAHGALRVAGTLAEPLGRLDLIGNDVVALDFEVGDVHALARVDRERLHVESLTADGPFGHVDARGDWLLLDEALEGVSLRVRGERLGEIWPARFERGAFDVQAELAGAPRALAGTFVAQAHDLALACGPTLGEIAALGSFDGDEVRFDELSAAFERARVRALASGVVRYREPPFHIALSRARVEREGLDLGLVTPIEFHADLGGIELADVALAGSAGQVVADALWRDGRFELRAECSELNPMPLVAPFAPEGFALARAGGNFELAFDDGWRSLSADCSLEGLRFIADSPLFDLRCRGSYADGNAQIETLELRGEDGSFAGFSGALPFDFEAQDPWGEGELSLSGSFSAGDLEHMPWQFVPYADALAGSLAGELELAGSWRDVRGRVSATGRGIRARASQAFALAPEMLLVPADFDLSLALDDVLTIERLVLEAPGQLRLDVVGGVEIGGDLREFIERAQRGKIDAPLDLQGTFVAPDLTFVAGLAPATLRRTAGSLAGELALRGTLSQPHWSGEVRIENGEVRSQSDLPTIDRITGTLELADSRATIRELRGDVSAGSLSVSGMLELGGDEPSLELALEGRDLLLVQKRELRARANAALGVRGPWSSLAITGRLDLTDGRYSERVDWLETINQRRVAVNPHSPWFTIAVPPLADATFDVQIGAEHPFRIDNNVARAALRPNLTLRGTGRAPELVGDIYVESGRVILPESTLELRSGNVALLALEPRRPVLDLSLETRVAGHDISVQVRGRTGELEIEPVSTPPLTREAILELLLHGQFPTEGSLSETGIETAQVVAVYLGKDMLTRLLGGGDEYDENSLIERLEWRRGADVTQAGGSTFDARLRLDGPQQGRGRVLYLRGERDLYDRINFGLRVLWRRK